MRCRECGREFPEWTWDNPICPQCRAGQATATPAARADEREGDDFYQRHPELKIRGIGDDYKPDLRTVSIFEQPSSISEKPAPTVPPPVERIHRAPEPPPVERIHRAPEPPPVERIHRAPEPPQLKPRPVEPPRPTPRPVDPPRPFQRKKVAQSAPPVQPPREIKMLTPSKSGEVVLTPGRSFTVRSLKYDDQPFSNPKVYVPIILVVVLIVLATLFAVATLAPLAAAMIALIVFVLGGMPKHQKAKITAHGLELETYFGPLLTGSQTHSGAPRKAVVRKVSDKSTLRSEIATALRGQYVVEVSGDDWSEQFLQILPKKDHFWLEQQIRKFINSLK